MLVLKYFRKWDKNYFSLTWKLVTLITLDSEFRKIWKNHSLVDLDEINIFRSSAIFVWLHLDDETSKILILKISNLILMISPWSDQMFQSFLKHSMHLNEIYNFACNDVSARIFFDDDNDETLFLEMKHCKNWNQYLEVEWIIEIIIIR